MPTKRPAYQSSHIQPTPGYQGLSSHIEPNAMGTQSNARFAWTVSEEPKKTNNTKKCNGKVANNGGCIMSGGKLRRSSKRSTRRRKRR